MFKSTCLIAGFLALSIILSSVTAQDDENCNLYGGSCRTICRGATMGGGQQLCPQRSQICCNPHTNKCKDRGGECSPVCSGAMSSESADCSYLGRKCCIAL